VHDWSTTTVHRQGRGAKRANETEDQFAEIGSHAWSFASSRHRRPLDLASSSFLLFRFAKEAHVVVVLLLDCKQGSIDDSRGGSNNEQGIFAIAALVASSRQKASGKEETNQACTCLASEDSQASLLF